MTENVTPGRWQQLKSSLTLHTLIVGGLIVLMLIPLLMVDEVVEDRNHYRNQVLHNMASTWGAKQTLTGPFLVIPYVEHFTSVDTVADGKGETKVVTKDVFNEYTAIILPESLDIRADLKEEHRKRGIYDALVYNANIKISGEFDHEFLLEAEEGERRILWEQSYLMMGISDTKAIGADSALEWDRESVELQPGTRLPDMLPQGFHVPLDNTTSNDVRHDFKLDLKLRGSDGLFFAPLGKTTIAKMTSGWPHPSFQGSILPAKRKVGELGFTAEWEIANLARNYPQSWLISENNKAAQKYDPTYFTAGVSLYEPVSLYSQIERAVKYGILFVALTFLTFFAFEIASGARLHILQYGLIGFALSLFYLILLSLAEHLPFIQAYIAAGSTVVVMIWIYAWAVLRSFWKGLWVFITLGGLYYLLFMILQMEDYALLAGTGLLVFATLMMMFATRRVRA